MADRAPILSPTFAVLSVSTLCFFLSLSIVIPVLPRALADRGARPLEVGLVLGSMAVPAVLLRPLLGKIVDRRGRRPFVVLGLAGSALACLGYAAGGGFVVAARLLHGAGIASFYPAASALTADLAPAPRRAEAIGYFSTFLYAGLAVGPAVGELLAATGGPGRAFLAAALVSAAGTAVAAAIAEPRRPAVPPKKGPLLHRAAAFPALVLGLAAFSFAGIGAFVPLYVAAEGAGTSREFFFTMALTVIVMRLFVGRLADRFGRAAVVIPGGMLCAAGMFTVAASASRAALTAGAVLYGMGWGGLFPGLLAATIDRVPPSERGSATGTLTASFDAALGGGQAVLGALLQASNFTTLFAVSGLGGLAAAVVFASGQRRWSRRPVDVPGGER